MDSTVDEYIRKGDTGMALHVSVVTYWILTIHKESADLLDLNYSQGVRGLILLESQTGLAYAQKRINAISPPLLRPE